MSKRGKYGNGRVYQPKYRATDGTLKTVSKWYIQFYDQDGAQVREPAKHENGVYAATEREARSILTNRMSDTAKGIAPTAASRALRYGDIRAALLTHYATHKMKSLEVLSGTGEQSLRGL